MTAIAAVAVAPVGCATASSAPAASAAADVTARPAAPRSVRRERMAPRPEPAMNGPVLRALRTSIDSMIAQPVFRNAHWGIMIVDPVSGDTLYAHEAAKLFMPASNMKIATGGTALAQLGPHFRFHTTFLAAGPVRQGVLAGDLVVAGHGDPTISTAMRGDAMRPLRHIADSLRARGITRITGHLVAAPDVFQGAPLGYGWSWDDLAASYGAGVDALFFNQGAAKLVVRGGRRIDDRVTAALSPDSSYPALRVSARTGAATALTVLPDSAGGTIDVTGTVAPRDSVVEAVVYPDQQQAYLAALRTALLQRGIALGGARSRSRVVPDSLAALTTDTLFTVASPPLREILAAMAKPSQNQIAEILFKTLAFQVTGVGSADSARAVIMRQLGAWGADPDGYVIHDGSGLSRYDYLSPATIVRALDGIRRDSAFSAWFEALPVGGLDGTLAHRMRGTAAMGNVHAKTGYLANARSLSGYVTTRDGRLLIFTALCNNWTAPVQDVDQVQDAIAVALARLDLHGRW